MNNRIMKTAVALVALVPALAAAQSMPRATREKSWMWTFSGSATFLDASLKDFLGSGAPESRFANTATPTAVYPGAEVQLGYNFTEQLAVSAGLGGATGSGIRFLTPFADLTYNVNLNAQTSPFFTAGSEITRIDGQNKRTTHSNWGAHVGVGIRRMLSDNVALRLEGRAKFDGYQEVPMSKNTVLNPMALIGLTYFVGRHDAQVVMAPRTDTIRTVRVDTIRSVRRDTIRSVRVDTVIKAPAFYDADQVILRVQFRTDRAELLEISYPVLDTVAAAIKATAGSKWQVEGHTDSVGTAAYNKTLSRARAQTVVDYLASKGVDRSIMTAEGFGSDRQVFSNTTAEGRAQNRRVQLRRIPPPPTVKVP